MEAIKEATKDFQLVNRIGKGGYGVVYKGELDISGKPTSVAIKWLDEQFGQGLKEFLTEIDLLSGQTHENLITLLGYCDDKAEKIIVYEYAERGSLDMYLRSSHTIRTLIWMERLDICVGAARGLDHLHNGLGNNQAIIHRDIKSANILIDENWVAKISDFGLSKLIDRSYVVSHACGTHAYCEPEYHKTSIVTKESDVYSFGLVLFEVLCGRLCTKRDDDGFLISASLAKKYYEDKRLDEIVDPILKKEMNLVSMNKFAEIAYRCLHDVREQRPTMCVVLEELDQLSTRQLLSLLEDDAKKPEWRSSHISQSPGSKYYQQMVSQGSSSKSEYYRQMESQGSSSKSDSTLEFQSLSSTSDLKTEFQSLNSKSYLKIESQGSSSKPYLQMESQNSSSESYLQSESQSSSYSNSNSNMEPREGVDAPNVATNVNDQYGVEELRSSLDDFFNLYEDGGISGLPWDWALQELRSIDDQVVLEPRNR
ncbi:putative serine/threonine-protein kinase PBL22 [Bidens hawaiensis]|uniref:putative serine/threonine-protein kinase PBL22 n=1 Tax=Bidens hawaiensis TaxID=980011 RepID=UPI004049DE88